MANFARWQWHNTNVNITRLTGVFISGAFRRTQFRRKFELMVERARQRQRTEIHSVGYPILSQRAHFAWRHTAPELWRGRGRGEDARRNGCRQMDWNWISVVSSADSLPNGCRSNFWLHNSILPTFRIHIRTLKPLWRNGPIGKISRLHTFFLGE